MRLLVLDGSLILHHVVGRLAPEDVNVISADSFDRACAILRDEAPDAAIVNLGPSPLPWREFQRFCREHRPPIPVLFESCIFNSAEEAGLDDINGSCAFLSKPYHTEQLRAEIDRLVRVARQPDSGERQHVGPGPAA